MQASFACKSGTACTGKAHFALADGNVTTRFIRIVALLAVWTAHTTPALGMGLALLGHGRFFARTPVTIAK
jgi:hypothetical protein